MQLTVCSFGFRRATKGGFGGSRSTCAGRETAPEREEAGSEAFDGFTKSSHALHKSETVGQGRALYDINGNAAGLCCFDLFLEISAFPTFLCQYGIWMKLVQQLLLVFSFMEKIIRSFGNPSDSASERDSFRFRIRNQQGVCSQ